MVFKEERAGLFSGSMRYLDSYQLTECSMSAYTDVCCTSGVCPDLGVVVELPGTCQHGCKVNLRPVNIGQLGCSIRKWPGSCQQLGQRGQVTRHCEIHGPGRSAKVTVLCAATAGGRVARCSQVFSGVLCCFDIEKNRYRVSCNCSRCFQIKNESPRPQQESTQTCRALSATISLSREGIFGTSIA
jgi:hypothetical protein